MGYCGRRLGLLIERWDGPGASVANHRVEDWLMLFASVQIMFKMRNLSSLDKKRCGIDV